MIKMLKLKHRDTINFSKKDFRDLVYIGVYTSQKCNLRCKYCFEDSSQPAMRETTLQERIDTISQAKDLGAEVLLITGAGEPLIDDALFPMIEHAYKLELGTLLYTNGLEGKNAKPISEESARFLYDHDVTAIVKLESLNPKTHDYLTSVIGSHRKAIESFQRMRKAGYGNIENDVTKLGVAALYTLPTLEELPELKQWCTDQGIKLYVDVIGVHGRAKTHKNIIPTQKQILAIQEKMGKESGIISSGECIFWKHGLIIDQTGNARFCTEINTNDIGNIKEHSIKELLNTKNRQYPSKPGKFTCPLKSKYYTEKE